MSMKSDKELLEETFQARYNSLDKRGQIILQICAFLGRTVSLKRIFTVLGSPGLPGEVKLSSPAQVNIYLGNLRKLELTDYQDVIDTRFIDLALKQSVHERYFNILDKNVKSVAASDKVIPMVRPARKPDVQDVFRLFRNAVYSGDTSSWEKHLKTLQEEFDVDPFNHLLNNPFDPELLATLPLDIQLDFLLNSLKVDSGKLFDVTEKLDYLMENLYPHVVSESGHHQLALVLGTTLLLKGRLEEARRVIKDMESIGIISHLEGVRLMMTGNYDKALKRFEKDFKRNINPDGTKVTHVGMIPWLFHTLGLIYKNTPVSLKSAETNIDKNLDHLDDTEKIEHAEFYLKRLLLARKGEKSAFDQLHTLPRGSLVLFIAGITEYAISGKINQSLASHLRAFFDHTQSNHYDWLAMEFGQLIEVSGHGEKGTKEYIDEVTEKRGTVPLSAIFEVSAVWENQLESLMNFNAGSSVKKEAESRLVWFLETGENYISLIAKIQKLSAKGKWSKGKKVAMKRLESGAGLPFMSSHDHRICGCIKKEYGWYRDYVYEFDLERLPGALIGHPLVFENEQKPLPVEIVKGEPEIFVRQNDKNLHITFDLKADRKVILHRESPTRYKVIEFTDDHMELHSIIGHSGLKVPASAKKRVLEAIGAISTVVTIQSEIGGTNDKIPSVPGNPQPRVHLFPVGSCFGMEMFVKPFSTDGPLLKPGKGGANIIAELNGERKQAKRDLSRELALSNEVIDACPALEAAEETNLQWYLPDTETSLELLLELQELQEKKLISVEWPEGEKLKASAEIESKRFNININSKSDWFEITGELTVDNDQVIDLKKLLDLTEHTPSRFIPLGDGQFLTLTGKLKKRLDELRAYTDTKGKTIGFHPVATVAVDELLEDFTLVKSDKIWKSRIKRLRDGEKHAPVIPSTLKAELRDYQQEGFAWLSRLAFWGMGACLADDMGLGKTLQSIAVILDRAPMGPSMVVAPTSVCMNWMDEAKRFAPTLNAILFGAGNRKERVENLGPMDILVVSYGLLQQESETIQSRNWNTIVLDEAQAIKNAATKRSKTAMGLTGDFKIITTGTPIENHLGELKNLFDFINPGLLGTDKRFNNNYAIPIEKNRDRNAAGKLKKLIRPFILRRLKSQVLEELPPKTEIVLHVEMGKEEASFYQAIREKALENLASKKNGEKAGETHLRILAEITRLRRACCNPSLVMPDAGINSSKLAQFGELVDELIENRHKTLVFSQFTGHLALIREYLDKKGIDYRYLDGSTPQKKRKTEIEDFQAGKGDLFLISLKAGGTGLNLTAASYVIHMDPWWNPAVEDQASDRAHRIGQEQPVTVYRLVMKDTIEDKIINLHKGKRDLAENLLSGTDISGKITADELVELIKQ